jgi:hypothetical protein
MTGLPRVAPSQCERSGGALGGHRAWIGARVYVGVPAETFQRVVLFLLTSGGVLLGQALTR